MHDPTTCTCGRVIANVFQDYERALAKGIGEENALADVQIGKACCRTRLISRTVAPRRARRAAIAQAISEGKITKRVRNKNIPKTSGEKKAVEKWENGEKLTDKEKSILKKFLNEIPLREDEAKTVIGDIPDNTQPELKIESFEEERDILAQKAPENLKFARYRFTVLKVRKNIDAIQKETSEALTKLPSTITEEQLAFMFGEEELVPQRAKKIKEKEKERFDPKFVGAPNISIENENEWSRIRWDLGSKPKTSLMESFDRNFTEKIQEITISVPFPGRSRKYKIISDKLLTPNDIIIELNAFMNEPFKEDIVEDFKKSKEKSKKTLRDYSDFLVVAKILQYQQKPITHASIVPSSFGLRVQGFRNVPEKGFWKAILTKTSKPSDVFEFLNDKARKLIVNKKIINVSIEEKGTKDIITFNDETKLKATALDIFDENGDLLSSEENSPTFLENKTIISAFYMDDKMQELLKSIKTFDARTKKLILVLDDTTVIIPVGEFDHTKFLFPEDGRNITPVFKEKVSDTTIITKRYYINPTPKEYNELKKGNELVIVNFSSVNCGPCQRIKSSYRELQKEYKDVIFIYLDVDNVRYDDHPDLADVKSTPTFKGFLNGKIVGNAIGPNLRKVRNIIKDAESAGETVKKKKKVLRKKRIKEVEN